MNADRSASARTASRRSQPRTVAAARPSRPAIARQPRPAAASLSASPITPAPSARRTSTQAGSNTWVRSQLLHAARRGRSRRLA